MRQYFCTYFDRNYLTRGLALLDSLRAHSKDFKIFIVCMDEYTRLVLSELNFPEVQLIGFHEIEKKDPDLTACRNKRKVVEYIWTSTPAIIWYILDANPQIASLTYVDADLYFFSDPAAVVTELGNKSVLIHEHRFPERNKHLAEHGIYNVGLLVFKNDSLAREVLQDWRIKCIDWCHDYVDQGRFGDQGYLNDWPGRFPQVVVTKNIGVGVAPWNHELYRYSVNSVGQPCVDGVPIVFYHYHSFKILHPEVFVPAPDPAWCMPVDCIRLCFLPYLAAIRRAHQLVESKFGEFPFGYANQSFSLALHQVVLASNNLIGELQKIGLSQPIQAMDQTWTVFKGQQFVG